MENKVKAVVCSLNSQYIHSSLAPWCLLAGVEKYCHDGICAEVVEGTVNEAPEKVLERILACRPMAVGFCCYIWNITSVLELVTRVKEELSGCVVVLGGPEVSYNAKEVLQSAPLVDFVISGEGELPFAKLLLAINSGSEPEGIPGLCWRKGGEIMIAQPHTPCEIPPSPYNKNYFSALKGRIAYLETSRGCPYSCAFCLSGRCGGVRYYELERAKQELLLLANSGARTVKLVDRTFNANKKRSDELFRFIIEHYGKEIPQGICFHFELAGDLPDDQTISLLATAPAGSMQFEIGLQSFNPTTLTEINRATDVEKLRRNISSLLANGNAHIHIDLIAGLPYEDMESFSKSFDLAFALRPHMLQLGFLKLLHGAPMREQPERFACEFDKAPAYEVTKTPWLSNKDLEALHHTEHALNQLYNRGRFQRTLSFLLDCTGKTPFTLFSDFGNYLFKTKRDLKSLDDFTAQVYSYFTEQPGVEKNMLRDCMVCDRLATNSSGKLPKALQIKDPRLKAAVKALERDVGRNKTVKRGYALLYGKSCLVYADYENKSPVTGEYCLQEYPYTLAGGPAVT